MYVIFKIVGYVGWIATAGLGVAGSWFWNFTNAHPSEPGKKVLTRPGRYAIGIMALSLSCAVVSTIYTEYLEYHDRLSQESQRKKREKEKAEEKAERERMSGQISALRTENATLQSQISQLLRRHGIWHFAAADRKLYEKLEYLRLKVRGRSEERKRITRLVGDTLAYGSLAILSSFNLRNLSKRNTDYKLEQVAGIIAFMEADVVCLQEIKDQEILAILRRLLPQYECRYLNIGKNRSGLAILYRRATVYLVDEPEPILDASDFGYVPITQRIKIGTVTFRIVNLHLSWGGRGGHESPQRASELTSLLKWIHDRKEREQAPLLLAGMFFWNLDRPEMASVREAGFYFPSSELPAEANESPFQDTIRRYTQFAIDDRLKHRYISRSIRYEALRKIYPNKKGYKDWIKFLDNNPLLIALRVD